MPTQTIVRRVDRLEVRVTDLERLPDRISSLESQILQMRTEMAGEFSAVRHEIADCRRDLNARIEETLRYMRVLHEDVIGRLAIIQEGQPSRRRRGPEDK